MRLTKLHTFAPNFPSAEILAFFAERKMWKAPIITVIYTMKPLLENRVYDLCIWFKKPAILMIGIIL